MRIAATADLHFSASRHAVLHEHDEQRRAKVHARVLQRARDFRRDHVARETNHEQLAEAGIEDQFRRHA